MIVVEFFPSVSQWHCSANLFFLNGNEYFTPSDETPRLFLNILPFIMGGKLRR
jgi:hypothetical protein